MVSLSNNDRFDNDKIFLYNIWHFSVIARINDVSIFFVFVDVFSILCQNVIFGTFLLLAVFDTIRPKLFYI